MNDKTILYSASGQKRLVTSPRVPHYWNMDMRLMSHSHQHLNNPKTKLASSNTVLRSQSILFYELYTQ